MDHLSLGASKIINWSDFWKFGLVGQLEYYFCWENSIVDLSSAQLPTA